MLPVSAGLADAMVSPIEMSDSSVVLVELEPEPETAPVSVAPTLFTVFVLDVTVSSMDRSSRPLDSEMWLPVAVLIVLAVLKIGPLLAIGEMFALNLRLPFQVAALRRAPSSFAQKLRSVGGLFSSGNEEVEQVVHLIKQKAALSRRIAFLNHTHRVFNLWHVIHRPFSYAFAVLAVLHICVVMGLGFMSLGLR